MIAWMVLSIAASVTVIGYIFYVKMDNDRLVALSYWSAEFEKATLELTRDSETPLAILRLLKKINSAIGHPNSSYFLFEEVNEYNIHKFEPNFDDVPEELRDCNIEMKKRLHGPLRRALKSGISALAYSSLIYGFRVRALLFELELVDDVGACIITHASEKVVRKSNSDNAWRSRWRSMHLPRLVSHTR